MYITSHHITGSGQIFSPLPLCCVREMKKKKNEKQSPCPRQCVYLQNFVYYILIYTTSGETSGRMREENDDSNRNKKKTAKTKQTTAEQFPLKKIK